MSKKLEIVELADIEKEFMLVDARLRLFAKESDQAFTSGIFKLILKELKNLC